jgi:hypothetical protein
MSTYRGITDSADWLANINLSTFERQHYRLSKNGRSVKQSDGCVIALQNKSRYCGGTNFSY